MKAELKNHRQSPRKVRLVADLIRGKRANKALALLDFSTKRASLPIRKLLKSALANAKNKDGLNAEQLKITKIEVNEGPTLKRIRPVWRGMAHRIHKRTSKISLVLDKVGNKNKN
jgi:large subunit ribosomal protein L22